LEVTELLANSHLRVVSVADVEIYMQGMTFRAIECDEAGSARFSLHPMRAGEYELYVRDHSAPPPESIGRFGVESAGWGAGPPGALAPARRPAYGPFRASRTRTPRRLA